MSAAPIDRSLQLSMTISAAFIERSRHYLVYEYPTKIERCLEVLPADALWRRANERSNSIGNLLLHVEGNVRQWIVCGVGGAPDHRQRQAEFAALEGGHAHSLFAALKDTLGEAEVVIAALGAEDLVTRRTIQGRNVTVLDAVYHVVEHLSLHTGQIILLTKQAAPEGIQFYEDAGGLAIPRWRERSSDL